MKNLILYGAIVVLFTISVILGINLATRPKLVQYTEKPSDAFIDQAKTQAKILAEKVDEQGFKNTAIQRSKDVIGNADLSGLPISRAVYDSLRLDNIEKGKKLQQASYLVATFQARDLVASRTIDSLRKLYYVYNDDYVTAIFSPDSVGGKFDLSYRIKLITHDYKKRKNFFSPYTNYTDILSPDKRISINGMQSLSIRSDRPTKWGIGLQAGYYYDPLRQQISPAIGLGLSYNLIRF